MMHALSDVVGLIQKLEPAFADNGYHLGLTGGVLFRGSSEKDADLICYPHKNDDTRSQEELVEFIRSVGFETKGLNNPEYHQRVIVCYRDGKRYDFFLL